jgi:hypothetical protein
MLFIKRLLRPCTSKNLMESGKTLQTVFFYTGGWLATNLQNSITCESCVSALFDYEKTSNEHSSFVAFRPKNDDEFSYPSNSTFFVLKKTEPILQKVTQNLQNVKNIPVTKILYNLRIFFSDDKYFPECRNCVLACTN